MKLTLSILPLLPDHKIAPPLSEALALIKEILLMEISSAVMLNIRAELLALIVWLLPVISIALFKIIPVASSVFGSKV